MAFATTRIPVASQPLSTDERIGTTGSPLGGQTVRTSPFVWSYQLKYWPLASCRSIVSSEPRVVSRRATASSCSMNPRRSATTVLHMYAPMFVVDVWTLGVPSAARLSAGSPVSASVIATNDAQVCSAYPSRVAR